MTKHTPGPWDVIAEDGVGCWVFCLSENSGPEAQRQDSPDDIAQICWRGVDSESLANARLIAAAPDLLEVATAIRKRLDPIADLMNLEFMAELDAAIAKAEGKE